MAETKPTRVLDATSSMENASEQQYIEVGSNMYLGTKDGMKYTLVETPDNKFRLVETLSDLSENEDISSGSLVKKEGQNEEIDEWMRNRSGSKLIKLVAEPSPCRGQGDERGNTVLSDHPTQEDESIDRGSELTYTTLLPRHEKADIPDSNLSPASDYYDCSPSFSTPIAVRPPRYVRKQPRLPPCSPVLRVRGAAPRQRRPKQTIYQYNPQMLHSTPGTVSSTSNDSQVAFSDVGSATSSGHSYAENQISVEYPRVPNNTPNSSEAAVGGGNQDVFSLQWIPHVTNRPDNYISLDPRESHNEKERKRRLRIKNACQSMRSLLPSVTEKTDNATVFEEAVNFIAFVRDAVGNEHDLEFLEQMYVP